MKDIPVITIDGPSSSGKGVVSKLLAEKLGWHLLDSGAIYRALAFEVISRKIHSNDTAKIVAIAEKLAVKFVSYLGESPKIILGGKDVTIAIRSEECGIIASKIAAYIGVRKALIEYQRSFCQSPGLVADGRDMGTKIFPYAKLKIFLTADVTARAKRRLLQLQDHGINATLDTVLQGLVARDKRDHNRQVSPLKPAVAAMIIDTTRLSVDEVLQQILAHVKTMPNLILPMLPGA